jgi:CheY-like chemotaxis protein
MTMPLQILVVEDDTTVARLVRYCLEGQGHSVRVATDGVAALASVYADPPDLILLDLMLPNLSGHLVCQALRGDDRTRAISIVLLTGATSHSEAVQACGPDGFLQKPFTPHQLLEVIAPFARGQTEFEGRNGHDEADSGCGR